MLKKVREIAARVVKPNRLIVASAFMFIAAAMMALSSREGRHIYGGPDQWMLLPTIAGGVITLLWNHRHVALRLIIAIIFMLIAVHLTPNWLVRKIVLPDWFDEWFFIIYFFAVLPLPLLSLWLGFVVSDILAEIASILSWIVMLAAFAGGVSTLISTLKKRRLWSLALAGAICAILCCPVAGLAATVITVSSRNEFRQQ